MIIKREYYNKKIQKAFNILPIVVLIGARQVGKTTIMNNYEYEKNILFLNGQNSEISELFSKYSLIETYIKLNLNPQLDGYLLIDEFQFIPGISTTIKLLTDKNKYLKIIATGSSSLDIIQKVEESLAGRIRMINVYSLSFPEYIRFYDEILYEAYKKYDKFTDDKIINKEIKILELNYLTYGGLPRVALTKNNNEKIEILNDIYQTYLLRDVKAYVKNEDSVGFNKMLRLVSAQIGNLQNVNELSRSSGLSYKKTTEYLYLLEQMYILKQLDPYFSNMKKTITKMKKLYFFDLGMRNIIYNSFNDISIRVDNGAIFENYVFLELIKHTQSVSKLFFYRTRDGAEVDFVLDDMIEKKSIEVKFRNFDKPVKFKTLYDFNKSENIKSSFLVNLNLNAEHNDIHYIQSCLISKIESTPISIFLPQRHEISKVH